MVDIDIYENFEKICDMNDIGDEEKRILFMRLISQERELIKKEVNLDDLKEYLKENKKKSNCFDCRKYLLSDVYGVFLGDNSFVFAYDYIQSDGMGLAKCDNYEAIVFERFRPWYFKENFKTLDGDEACAFSIWEVVPVEMLLGSANIMVSDLTFLEKKINHFMKKNPSLVENILRNRKSVKVRTK